ncbi:MAG: ParB/RepB/Spo0J family partition protein, partial [Gordonia sp. (in: high G+C Gram-positive bacteria)]
MPPSTVLVDLAVDSLIPHTQNIRRSVGDITDLAKSIAVQGILEPLVVTPNGAPGRYIILAGHRRHAAAVAAKCATVPCLIRHDLVEEADQIGVMLAENIERAALTPVEEAAGVMALFELGESPKTVAARTGMSVSRVRSRAKIGRLSPEVQEKLIEHAATLEDAEFIAAHAGVPEDLKRLEEALGTNNWAVERRRVVDRVAERKKLAAARKEAKASGIDVVESWEARRARWAELHERLEFSWSDAHPRERPWDLITDPKVVVAEYGDRAVDHFLFAPPETPPMFVVLVRHLPAATPLAHPDPDDDADPSEPSGISESESDTESEDAAVVDRANAASAGCEGEWLGCEG